MFLSSSISILLNLIPSFILAGFKRRFTLIPLCNPTPSNSIGSLIVFLFHSLFYLDGFTGKVVYKISLSTIIELFSSPANIDILIRTVVLASVVSIGAAIIGFPIAYFMAKFTTPKIKIFFYLAIMLPLWSSYLVRVYSWKLILAKEGIISWFFAKLHLSWLLEAILALPVIGGPSLSISYLGMFLVFTYIFQH